VLALGVNLIALELLIRGGMSDLPAQALAVIIAMPFNFIGNKLWTFE
jgi:putative flippase GtrA